MQRKRAVYMNTVVIQQDGAPAHCSNRALSSTWIVLFRRQVIFQIDRRSIVSIFRRFQLPRLLLLGFLKDRVYKVKPPKVERLKGHIRREIKRIPAGMLERAIDNFSARLAGFIQQRKVRIEHFINYQGFN